MCFGEESEIEGAKDYPHLALPIALTLWKEWVESETTTAEGQGFDPLSEGVTLILKKNGRVGVRRRGMPDWSNVLADVSNRASSGLDITNI